MQQAAVAGTQRIRVSGGGIRRLLTDLEYLSEAERGRVLKAYEYGARAHHDQRRLSGEPYISHPVAVATILAQLRLDSETIIAALLHDVIEDTPTLRANLEQDFGGEVAAIVDGVTKLTRLREAGRMEAQVASFRKMMLAMVDDIRVILVKLADRLHNLRTLDALEPSRQRRIARETLEIYAPIANRLGIRTIRREMEDLGFRYAWPRRYRVISRAMNQRPRHPRSVLRRVSDRLRRALKAAELEGNISARAKSAYSIYCKMRDKRLAFKEIADVIGLRVIVPDIDACYRCLGIAHQLFRPMPGRFKDYIAIPRVNGYQSLHTVLLGPEGMPLEFQIRTAEMHRVAESGIAAHWQYKAEDKSVLPAQFRTQEWLRRITEMQATAQVDDFYDHVKVDLFPDKVYVFTPKGEILRLPRGASCLDFAYAVHTDVGHRCVAARVDGQVTPLRTQLKNGQNVHILTSRNAYPNAGWLEYVATAKARSAILDFLKNTQTREAREVGAVLLNQALSERGSSLRKMGRGPIEEAFQELGVESRQELYEQIGLGERLATLAAAVIMNPGQKRSGEGAGEMRPVDIAGAEGMVVTYGQCCYPIPGDEVVGHTSSGRGFVIHRNTCGNFRAQRKRKERWIPVNWKRRIRLEFPAGLRIHIAHRPGVLAEVAARVAETGHNIAQVNMQDRPEESTELFLSVLVKDRDRLARVMRAVRALPSVHRVHRV
ncbi:RelA/SpoT family protein [Candidatus Foliamicus sp.]